MPEFQPNGRRVFTIVEVILAIVILAVGLLGNGRDHPSDRETDDPSQTPPPTGPWPCETTVERLRALPFDSVLAGTDSVGRYDITWNVTTAMKPVESGGGHHRCGRG